MPRNLNREFEHQLSFGDRVADKLTEFGGSWAFIGLFFFVLGAWMAVNTFAFGVSHFDEYPFILLNLLLSCLAAIQAPIIMMSQNRQADKDRLRAEHDYEINAKAEMEIEEIQRELAILRQDITVIKTLLLKDIK